jgi:hypothetical protein
MSPTQAAVRRMKLNAELELARKAGDLRGMQMALASLTSLNRVLYGTPEART